jgi:hypothetical protein
MSRRPIKTLRLGVLAGETILFLFYSLAPAAEFRHGLHPDPLPAAPEVWASCCHENDCMEAPVQISKVDAEQTLVMIADFPGFRVRSDIVRPSENGRSYFCTRLAEIPPTAENILCVFYARPSYVQNTPLARPDRSLAGPPPGIRLGPVLGSKLGLN